MAVDGRHESCDRVINASTSFARASKARHELPRVGSLIGWMVCLRCVKHQPMLYICP